MQELRMGWADVRAHLQPDSFVGAMVYLVLFVLVAMLLSRALRAAVHEAMTRAGHLDRTTISFMKQLLTVSIWVITLILYAHLIPVLRSLGTALLTGASIASVVIGLAAQSTLGNLIAGVAITLYRPFRLGDRLLVTAPTGTETGTVELISLGYTTLRTDDGRQVVVPNSSAASQVLINLSAVRVAPPLPIVIRVSRETDIEKARDLALQTGAEVVGKDAVLGCFLTRLDATGTTLELRVCGPDAAQRDELRSKLVAILSQRFGAAGLDAQGGRHASFS
ncbi:MAG TPA: mechanosensitive ion channel family protein [Steroidobacteraceae bacterium]|nr:mechanosensitive ion channel family protein [Steroidobacteraceae bacterium]